MKILFVHDHRFRSVDGVFYSTGGLNSDVLKRYASFGDSLDVVARIIPESSANNRWSEITDERVKIFGTSSFKYDDLEEKVRECDKLVVRLPSFLGNEALKLNKKYNKPYLVEIVGCAWDALWTHGFKGKIVAPYMIVKTRQLVKEAPYVIYVTNEFLQKRYPTKGNSIGCSDVSIKNTEKFEDLYASKRKVNPKIILGTAGAIDVRYKGQQYVIRALGELKKQGICNFEYQIAGNGDSSYLKSQIIKYNVEDEVKIVGSIPHDQISDWYKNLDVYVQPSKTEGLPRSLVEAMNEGVASVGSNVGGIPELLDDGSVFKKGNVKEICKILIKFSDETFRMKKAEKCYKKSLEYNSEILNKRRLDFMKNVFL